MVKHFSLTPPFFEIGPKSYLVGDELLQLALFADAAAIKYNIDVIITTPVVSLHRVAAAVRRLIVFAPHMDPLLPGRGVADILPESLLEAGARGVMLNHSERPLPLGVLAQTIARADEVGLATMVCADTVQEAAAVAHLAPNIIVAEPAGLIAAGTPSSADYVAASIRAVKQVNPDILVLQGAGIRTGGDVYKVIRAGAEATGSSSGVVNAQNREAMADEMIGAVRRAWDERQMERPMG